MVDILGRLKRDGFKLILVSYGDAPNIAKKVHYAHQIFPMLDGYIFLSQHQKPFTKEDVNMEKCFFVDDNASYLDETNAEIKIMFGEGRIGNKNPGYFSSNDWEEIYNYILVNYKQNTECE